MATYSAMVSSIWAVAISALRSALRLASLMLSSSLSFFAAPPQPPPCWLAVLGFDEPQPLLLALPFYMPNRDGMSESGRALIWDLLGSIGSYWDLLDFIELSRTLCLSACVDSEHS